MQACVQTRWWQFWYGCFTLVVYTVASSHADDQNSDHDSYAQSEDHGEAVDKAHDAVVQVTEVGSTHEDALTGTILMHFNCTRLCHPGFPVLLIDVQASTASTHRPVTVITTVTMRQLQAQIKVLRELLIRVSHPHRMVL